ALVQDEAGRTLAELTTGHDERGLAELGDTLVALGVERVALERPDGLLVERLLDRGLEVLAIHPNQVKAARPRFRVAGGKSDRFDAFVLCELARTDSQRFRALRPDSDETKALKALTRAREDLVATRVSLANQLRAELERFWSGAARVFAEVDSPICLAFLERYPSPADARGLGEKRLQGFLDRHGYCGRRAPCELIERLRDGPQGLAAELEIEARRAVVLALVAGLRPLVEQIKQLSAQIAGAVRAHPDGQIFLSLFRDPKSTVTAARLVAELGDCRERYPSAEAMSADAGMSPVAIESGKRRVAAFRRGCDHRLRAAVACLADSTRHHHPWARAVYRRARARGCDHPHAIRILGRAWLRVVWRMWQDRRPYDPARHGNFRRLNLVGG
ncbi:MAG: IS110 family transposase, partial [Actinobacteria bacterium]|nr:IS110 family transposase [Actinomycetota bacterium]